MNMSLKAKLSIIFGFSIADRKTLEIIAIFAGYSLNISSLPQYSCTRNLLPSPTKDRTGLFSENGGRGWKAET